MAIKAKLEQAAKAFNELMKLDPPIPMGRKVKMDALLADIKEAADQLHPEDKFPKDVVDTLVEANVFVKDEAKSRIKTLSKPKTKAKDKSNGKKSRYGHKPNTQAAALDDLFWMGTSIKDATKAIGASPGRTRSHLKHLEAIGLTVQNKGDEFKIKEASIE
jgi:hypothetical protein